MEEKIIGNVKYLTFKLFNKYNFFKHGFSTRIGGVSEGYYSSMNLRLGSSDLKENINENFDLFLNVFDLDKKNTILSDQVHGSRVISIKNIKNNEFKECDGLISDLSNIGLMTFHADCVPVYFVDIKKKIVGLVHSGWKGTYLGISKNIIKKFVEGYESNVEDIIVGIGPAIENCCYEVGLDVYNKFINKNTIYKKFFTKRNDKYMMDLKGIIYYDLINHNIKKCNIEKSELCTKCRNDLFFSHRRHGLKRGTMAAIIKKEDI